MHLDSSQIIGSIPILRIRHFLKLQMQWDGPWSVETAMWVLKISRSRAQRLIKDLQALGLIETNKDMHSPGYWNNTIAGNALALAKASKPITRATADRALKEFLERCHRVNSDPGYHYYVKRCLLFGSYLSESDRIGDVDLALDIRRKLNAPPVDLVHPFGEYERVCRYLKSRSRSLSLHILHEEDGFYKRIPHKVLEL